jgi:predicted Fe-Mo cluster-binding NifX family protein
MKVAISSTGKELDSAIDFRFGRCAYFIIVDVDKKKKKFDMVKAIANPNVAVGGGAGVSAAQLVANEKAEAVITGNIGPRAHDVFQQLNIEAYRAEGTVKEAVELFIDGKLEKISIPGPIGIGKPGIGRGAGRGSGRGQGMGRGQGGGRGRR